MAILRDTPCLFYQVQSCWIMYWTCHTSRIFRRSTCMCRQTMTMQLPSIKSLDLKSQTPYGIIIWTSVHPIVMCSVKSLPNLRQKNDPFLCHLWTWNFRQQMAFSLWNIIPSALAYILISSEEAVEDSIYLKLTLLVSLPCRAICCCHKATTTCWCEKAIDLLVCFNLFFWQQEHTPSWSSWFNGIWFWLFFFFFCSSCK